MRTTTRLAAVRAAAAAGALAVGLAGLGASASAVDNLASIRRRKGCQGYPDHSQARQPEPGTVIGHASGTAPKQTSAPVKGVEFTAYKIDLDLTQQANWETLATAAKTPLASSVCDGPKVGAGLPVGVAVKEAEPAQKFDLTNEEGQAKKELGRGAYLICETDTAAAQVAGADVQVIDKALPFIVTLPYPDNNAKQGATHEWIYDVHSFPEEYRGQQASQEGEGW